MVLFLRNLNSESRTLIKKVMVFLSVISFALLLFLSFLLRVPIDESTPQLLASIRLLRTVFAILTPLIFIPTGFFCVIDEQERRKRLLGKRKSKLNKQIHAFDIFNISFMMLFMIISIYPIIYVLAGSFNQGADYARGGIYLLPRLFTFENYTVVLRHPALWQSYLTTILRTSIGTITALIYTSIVAYAMSRPNLKLKGAFYWVNIFTMFFGGGLIPYFLIIRSLGLYNTFAVYIIPALYSVYHMIIMSAFFRTVSNELHEAAIMDGANEFRIYWQVYLPLSKPVLATVGLWLAIGHWNAYFDTMIFTNSPHLQTLQYFLLKAIQTSTMTEGMPAEMMMRLSPKTISLAAIIISMIPVLFFFPFVRKNFQSGIMIGSLKG